MKKLTFVLVAILGCWSGWSEGLMAETVDSPFDPHLQYSADLVSSNGQGIKMQELYSDGGKVRLETTADGATTVTIVRPDLQKFYFVVMAKKVVVDVPYAPNEFKNQVLAATGAHGTYQVVGPEATEGVSCIKYKGTAGDGATYFVWVDAVTKAPVKLARVDGTFAVVWKNFKVGAQNAALFEPPTDYQTITPPAVGH